MLKIEGKIYGSFKSSLQNTLKRHCLLSFSSKNIFAIAVRSILSVLSLCIENSMTWFNRSCDIVLCNQFLIRRIVEVDLSLTIFVAGDTRCNLKSIVIPKKNSLWTLEHCFIYLMIPEIDFSSDSINLVPNNCNFVDNR